MITKVIVLAFTLVLLFQGYVALNPCATPGFYLSSDNNHCFAYSALSREAHTHSIMCHAYGSKLVNIEDADKLSKVAAFLSGKGVTDTASVFIGLTNMLNNAKVWVWHGGNKTDYTNWAFGQPAIANRDNCVLMTAGNPDNKWKAASCLTGAFAVCEREAEIADLED